jgi:hypothetical protein
MKRLPDTNVRFVAAASAAATVLFFAGCRGSDDDGGSSGPAAGTGCVQGVVIDGLTGERVPLPASTPTSGVNVLVQTQLRGASLMTRPAPEDGGVALTDAEKALAGEYALCDVPADEAFPLFIWVDDYAPYETLVQVDSTAPSHSPKAREDVKRTYPTELVNVRLFPKHQEVKDLAFQVTHSGDVVKGATINLRPTGANFLDPDGALFHPPVDARQRPLVATTDAEGQAVFKAKDLVLGGHYTYMIVPPNGGSDQAAKADTIVVGLRSEQTPVNGTAVEPYLVRVDLENVIGDLAELSRSTDNGDPDPEGRLSIFFTREIELVPGTEDMIAATLFGNTVAALKPNVLGNNQPEQVKIRIEGNMLVLEPVYERQPSTEVQTELDMTVTYTGISVRPKSSPAIGTALPAINGTVKFYR